MLVVHTISEARSAAAEFKSAGHRIGFIPTMGFLHEGHLSLVRASIRATERSVVSIFVNPAQFAPHEDFDQYPRDYDRDLSLLEKEGVHLVFMPEISEIYPEEYRTFVEVHELQEKLEGISRPHFFRGVCTVVLKLLNIISPDVAYFGQKDMQQAAIIRRMVRDLDLDVAVEIGPIVRDIDGLALSSRNIYLDPDQRSSALCLSRSLQEAERMISEGERDAEKVIGRMAEIINLVADAKIDYIAIVHPDTLEPLAEIKDGASIALAVYIGKVRLIDNAIICLKE